MSAAMQVEHTRDLGQIMVLGNRKDTIHVEAYNNGLRADGRLLNAYNRWPQGWMLVPSTPDEWLENALECWPVPVRHVLVQSQVAGRLDLEAFAAKHPDIKMVVYSDD